MTAPIEPGKYEGDKFFAEGGIVATHVWSGGKWIELGDQTRTHGDDSAINDAPAGMDAIPVNMPDSPHGDASVEYTLQNFNALVAANTAMQTELGAAAAREAVLEERLAETKHNAEVYEAHAERYSKLAQERKTALDEATAELKFASDQRDELQRKLDRMSGYLDRVLDDEEEARAPETRAMPAPRPTVGPDFENIPRAERRTRGEAGWSTISAPIRGFDSVERPRRY